MRGLRYVSCLSLAAAFSYEDMKLCSDSTEGHFDDQKIALGLVQHILKLAGPAFDTKTILKSDAVISAASRGYNDVIMLLRRHGVSINARNGWLSAVITAISSDNAQTCRLLCNLGATARVETYRLNIQDSFPSMTSLWSPLHTAV
jgi:hypothetical protein